MTELRDARFSHALAHAPDAMVRPGDATRRAILHAAHQAVAPAAIEPWWRRWWAASGSRRAPWNAAFASILLASLVTVIWYDREVPDAAPERARTEAPSSEAPSPPMVQAPIAPAPAPPPTPAAPRKAAEAAKERSAAARAPQTQQDSRAEPAPPLRDAQPAPAPETSSAPVQAEPPRRADMATGQAASPPAPPAAAMPAPRAASPAQAMRMQAPAAWNQIRIEMDGRMTELQRGQASRLDGLVDALAASARDTQPLDGPVLARIETLQGGQPHGVLELAPPRIRWTARGAAPLTGQPDAVLMQALRDEFARLPGR